MKMLKLLLSALMILAMPRSVFGGPRVGNGGGGWVCRNSPSGPVQWIELLDLYEARQEFGLRLQTATPTKKAIDLVREKQAWVRQNIPAFGDRLDSYVERIEKNLRVTSGGLAETNQSYRIRPSARECPNGVIGAVQLANYTFYDKVLISGEAWNDPAFSEISKAALLFHEAIYLFFRELGDQDSTRARRVVGLLFSDLTAKQMNAKIQVVLDGNESGNKALCQAQLNVILLYWIERVGLDALPDDGTWDDKYAYLSRGTRHSFATDYQKCLQVCSGVVDLRRCERPTRPSGLIPNEATDQDRIDDFHRTVIENMKNHG
jgi:hypothetical protein